MDLTIGVIERQAGPDRAAAMTITDATGFARSLASRYEAKAFVASRADLALAWESPESVAQYYSLSRIEISPELRFEENYAFAAAERKMPVLNTPVGFDEVRASALFERLFSRQMRVAPFEAPSDAMPLSGPVQIPAPHQNPAVVERVLHQTRTAERSANSGEPPPARVPQTIDAGWGTPLPTPVKTVPVTLATPEIRRVADQVIREIDHRARAHRERTGRMAR